MNNNILLWLWLKNALDDKSVLTYKTYLHFKSIQAAYNATKEQLDELGFLKDEEKQKLLNKDLTAAENIQKICASAQIKIITVDDECYPIQLKEIYNYPCVLFLLGNDELVFKKPKLTVVGTRGCTIYGTSMTEKIVMPLARAGFCLVTGVAKGIDSAVIKSVLAAQGSIICVLPYGHGTTRFGTSYRYKDILPYGVILSEHLPNTNSHKYTYQERNRILSALSLGTLVTQAPIKSGAVMTANYALNQGKDVFALPANVDMPQSLGSNMLIRDGATPVFDYKDILFAYANEYKDQLTVDVEQPEVSLNPADETEEHDRLQDFKNIVINELDKDEKTVFSKIREGETDIDYIISSTELPTSTVMSIISALETKGAIVACPGNKYKIMI